MQNYFSLLEFSIDVKKHFYNISPARLHFRAAHTHTATLKRQRQEQSTATDNHPNQNYFLRPSQND